MFHRSLSPARRGFTLVELAIVLGVVGVLSLGLWRILSAGSQQTKDQATAQQQLQLINAVQGYLADVSANSGQAWLQTATFTSTASSTASLPLPGSNSSVANCASWYQSTYGATTPYQGLCNYLPPGFTNATTNPYGQTYLVQVMGGPVAATANQNYSFMIATTGGTTIPDTDGGRISTLIGSDGGFIYSSSAVCGATAPEACGTMGAWTIANIKSTYGFGSASAGTIASRSFAASATNNSFFWLARAVMPSDPTYTYNTMSTNEYMATGANLVMAAASNTLGSDIDMMPWSLAPNNPSATTTSTPGNTNVLYLGNGSINGDGNPNGTQISLSTTDTGSAVETALIQLTTGCTQNNLPTCALAAINIQQGDINLANGRVTAEKVYSASDARLKTNIHRLDDPLKELMKVDAVSFTFKTGGSPSMGVIAQNLEKVYPQLVSESNGTKYVEYNGLIGPLIGAVQELKRQNDDLREELRRQKLREDRLEKALGAKAATP